MKFLTLAILMAFFSPNISGLHLEAGKTVYLNSVKVAVEGNAQGQLNQPRDQWFGNINTHAEIAVDAICMAHVRSAINMDMKRNFNDLYRIKTYDRNKTIMIYCNSEHCYRSIANSLLA